MAHNHEKVHPGMSHSQWLEKKEKLEKSKTDTSLTKKQKQEADSTYHAELELAKNIKIRAGQIRKTSINPKTNKPYKYGGKLKNRYIGGGRHQHD